MGVYLGPSPWWPDADAFPRQRLEHRIAGEQGLRREGPGQSHTLQAGIAVADPQLGGEELEFVDRDVGTGREQRGAGA